MEFWKYICLLLAVVGLYIYNEHETILDVVRTYVCKNHHSSTIVNGSLQKPSTHKSLPPSFPQHPV